jgi:hypothetical protein
MKPRVYVETSATVHQVQVLASYNFRHLASVFAREKIESTLRQLGYQPPLIATPEAILGHDHGQS